MTKRHEALLAEKKKEFDNLYYRKATILKTYNDKIQQLRRKGQEIQDLIEKAKNGADLGLMEILNKWEEANLKIFEKYPSENQTDYSILEVAASEMYRIEAAKEQVTEEHKHQETPKPVKQSPKKKTGKDPELEKYIEEMKVKEQELEVKMKD